MKYKAANFRWTGSSLWTSVDVILFRKGEAYSNLLLTNVKYDSNKLSIVDKEKVNVVRVPPILSVLGFIHLPTHHPRMGSVSDCKSLRSDTELTVRKMLISSANKKCLEC